MKSNYINDCEFETKENNKSVNQSIGLNLLWFWLKEGIVERMI